MSAEITASLSLSIAKNGINVSGSASFSKDLTGSDVEALTVSTSTTAAAIPIGALAQVQSVLIKNTDPVGGNAVQIGLDSAMTQRFSTLQPNCAILLDNPPSAIYAKAAAGTPVLFVVAVES